MSTATDRSISPVRDDRGRDLTAEVLRTSMPARRVLALNAVFSLTTGTVVAVEALRVAADLGVAVGLVRATGVLVAAFGALLVAMTYRDVLGRRGVTAVAALDLVWVFASAVFLLAGPSGATTPGRWGVALALDVVAAFAIAELVTARRLPWHPSRSA